MRNKITIIIGIDSYPFRLDEFNNHNYMHCCSFAAARSVIPGLVKTPGVQIDYIRLGAIAEEEDPFDFIDWLANLQEENKMQFKLRNCWPDFNARGQLTHHAVEKGLSVIF